MENKMQHVNFVTNLVLKVLLALVAVALLLYSAKGGIFTGSLFSLKRHKPVLTVERTPMTVQDVRAVGKLVTANFYDEMIIKGNKANLVRTKDKTTGQIVIVQRANVRIGVDLAKLGDKAIQTQGDTTIQITLPPVECLHFIMNPSDTDVYSETTGTNHHWSFVQLQEVLEPVKDILTDKINESKVMEKASKGAEEIVTEFLTACGYKHVIITHTQPSKPLVLPDPESGVTGEHEYVTPAAPAS